MILLVKGRVFTLMGNLHEYIFSRLFCSNLHYNENSARKQARTSDNKLCWSITYPKAFKGEKAVAKPVKELPSYGKLCYCNKYVYGNTMLKCMFHLCFF